MKVWPVAATVLLAAASQAGADAKDVEVLLDGVTKIAAPGVPGPLCVFGDGAFAVVTGGAGTNLREPVVGASAPSDTPTTTPPASSGTRRPTRAA